MRSEDIVKQLAVNLPRFVDDFTGNVTVDSLTRSGTTVTVTTSAAHGLAVGGQVNVTGALTPLTCTITRNGIVGTLVTDADHDLTENAGFDVQIEGAIEPEFNGTFELISVPNRRTVTFAMDDSGPVAATGDPVLLNGASPLQQYNGLQEITAVPSTITFQYEIADATLPTPAAGAIVAKTLPRISAAIDIERVMESYTKQGVGDGWLFVVVGDAVADKSRRVDTDATDNIQAGNYMNQRLIQTVQLFVIFPSSHTIAGRSVRDRCEELASPICQSVLGVKFPSLFENRNNPLMITGHGPERYNTAIYAHQYSFEATLQLGPSDAFVPTDDVAFRDMDVTIGLDTGAETFETLIDLDVEQLP
jgi:hypothetical protein